MELPLYLKPCVAKLASPASSTGFWKDTALDKAVDEMRSLCSNDDPISCLKYRFMSLIDGFFKKDTFQILDNVEIKRNSYQGNEISGRSENTLEDGVEGIIQSHDVTFKLPFEGASVTVASGNLDKDEIDLKLRLSDEARGRKSKLKKIIVPIFIFILLKAMTLIPLALGVLGLKAWNALQLSFFSFVVSIALAIFQLCKKIAADSHPHHISHGPWDAAYARSFDTQPQAAFVNEEEAQKLAYSGYF
ncbi:uncharacterized protein LOC116175416 [Photinus pyralis]|uniref:uncharacterized protein LOC116175416 n=1 Tax=Photinus pyralis TaxID=7054 RepID=UPI001267283E|nr:uncharacterized protein LOC116175416 [Photinus pyralis]